MWRSMHALEDEVKDSRQDIADMMGNAMLHRASASSNYVVGDDNKITGGYDPFLQAIYTFTTPKSHPSNKK